MKQVQYVKYRVIDSHRFQIIRERSHRTSIISSTSCFCLCDIGIAWQLIWHSPDELECRLLARPAHRDPLHMQLERSVTPTIAFLSEEEYSVSRCGRSTRPASVTLVYGHDQDKIPVDYHMDS